MRFSYVTLNEDHQKLTGVLNAENRDEARRQLHAMGLSIISIDEEIEADYQKAADGGITTFLFRVLDSKGKESTGTIDAPSRKIAFKRLVAEYNFRILSLCDATTPLEEQAEKGREGLDEVAEEVKEEFGITYKEQKISQELQEDIEHSQFFLEQKKELVKNVEEVVEQAHEILEKFEHQITGDEIREVNDKINKLMRMRLSNNLGYIQNLADDLLVTIDKILQKHAAMDLGEDPDEGAILEEDLPYLDDDSRYQDNIAQRQKFGAASHVQDISKKLGSLQSGYQKGSVKKPKKTQKKKSALLGKIKKPKSALEKQMEQALRPVARYFKSATRAIRSNLSEKHQKGIRKMKQKGSAFFTFAHDKVEEMIEGIKKTPSPEKKEVKEKEEVKEKREKKPSSHFIQRTYFRICSEIHLFLGWLLAFYVLYFYIAVYTFVKWRDQVSAFPFLERSLSSSFPFLVTGIFFLLFLGLTLHNRFARHSFILPWVFLLFTGGSIGLFIVNF